MADSALDKSQPATPHRRQQARDQGQVAQSADLASAGLLIAGLLILLILGGQLVEFFAYLAQHQLGGESWLQADSGFIVSHANAVLLELAQAAAPILGLMLLAAVLVHILQTGFRWVPDRLALDFERINPLSGMQRLFSLSSGVRLAMGLLKVLVVLLVAIWSLYHRREELVAAAALDLTQLAAFIVDITLWTTLKIALALLVLGVFDYGYQRWKHEQQLRMTAQEVREEMKNLQGNPQVTARRRQVQRQATTQRGSAAIQTADLIVTDASGLAVALQYDAVTMAVPIVLAKGIGETAARIRRVAMDYSIPVRESKKLAQMLWNEGDLNRPIPDLVFTAVAELLADSQLQKSATPSE
ncbi:MAG TPA: EscU/YscU/HrcU family type III secretion system export apparatus switch protein [Pirellulales bacterium]